MSFATWLQHEMTIRDIGVRELGRMAEMHGSSISKVLNGIREPGPEFCSKIARALKLPEVFVFCKAGLLTGCADGGDMTAPELFDVLLSLDATQQRQVLEYVRGLRKEAKK